MERLKELERSISLKYLPRPIACSDTPHHVFCYDTFQYHKWFFERHLKKKFPSGTMELQSHGWYRCNFWPAMVECWSVASSNGQPSSVHFSFSHSTVIGVMRGSSEVRECRLMEYCMRLSNNSCWTCTSAYIIYVYKTIIRKCIDFG